VAFFKNKHVISALIVAPILAVLAYYLVDLFVREQPKPAVAGTSYQLVAKSNCRFSSGACDLVNGSFMSTLNIIKTDGGNELVLTSNYDLQNAHIGFVSSKGHEFGPYTLKRNGNDSKRWAMEFDLPSNNNTLLRIAITADNAHYFAETAMGFSHYETSYTKDLRN